jgi:hypothetical protein
MVSHPEESKKEEGYLTAEEIRELSFKWAHEVSRAAKPIWQYYPEISKGRQ